MTQSLKILFVISIALCEGFVITNGTWLSYVDFTFIALLALFIQKFGLIEIFSFFVASLILESVSIAPFGMHAFAVGLAIVLGRTLLNTVFTQRSVYSLFLFSLSLSCIFGVIMLFVRGLTSLLYNGNFSLSYQHLFLSSTLDVVVLFMVLVLQAKKMGTKYFTLYS